MDGREDAASKEVDIKLENDNQEATQQAQAYLDKIDAPAAKEEKKEAVVLAKEEKKDEKKPEDNSKSDKAITIESKDALRPPSAAAASSATMAQAPAAQAAAAQVSSTANRFATTPGNAKTNKYGVINTPVLLFLREAGGLHLCKRSIL